MMSCFLLSFATELNGNDDDAANSFTNEKHLINVRKVIDFIFCQLGDNGMRYVL